jgi:predicted O-methyltransferase YrrM
MASNDRSSRLRHRLAKLRWALRLCVLPPRVAWFHWRARRLASRTGDEFSVTSATRPADLKVLLGLARGKRRVVELGTATGWTAISLALAEPLREVMTFDVLARDEPGRYMGLVGLETRRQIELVIAPGSAGPRDERSVDLLYIDSSHDRLETVAEVLAWRPVLHPGSLIVFDDYMHPDFPGVHEAITELELPGEQRGTLYVHKVGSAPGE